MLVPCKESQTGMFSKAGKFSVEMFTLLQEKDTLMNNKKKQYFVGVANFLEDKNKKKSPYIKNSLSEEKVQKVQVEPFTKSTSRNYHCDLQSKEINNNQKNFGMYNPKYHFVFNKSPLNEDNLFNNELKENNRKRWQKFNLKKFKHHHPKKKKQAEIKKVYSEETFDLKDWKRGMRFSRQGERSSILNQAQPHEKRFEYLELPQVYTKVKRLANFNFEKNGKQNVNWSKNNEWGLVYDSNLDFVRPRTDRSIYEFDKMLGRTELHDESSYFIGLDYSSDLIQKKKEKSFSMGKTIGREKRPPAYISPSVLYGMQK